jgi:hypothetical protein
MRCWWELVGLVCFCDEVDYLGFEDATAYSDLNTVVRFDQLRRRAALREQHFKNLVEATAFAFHQFEVVKQAGEMLIAPHRGVQHVLRRNAKRQGTGIDDFQPIRVQIKKDVAALGVRAVHQGVDQQFAEHDAPILTALSRAFHWQRLIDEGLVKSGLDIARQEGLNQSTVNELLRLALLSPAVVRSILDGHQPKTLSLIWLKNNLLPPDWDEQHGLFDEFDA